MRSQLHRPLTLIVVSALTVMTTMTPSRSGAESMASSADRMTQSSVLVFMAASMASLDGQSTRGSGRKHDIISITPRVWLTQVDTAGSEDYQASVTLIPLYGGSIAFTPEWVKGLSVLFTGFHGEGDGKAIQPSNAPGNQRADREIKRTDIELLVRYQIPDTTVIVFFGPRYINFDQRTEFATYYIRDHNQILIVQAGVGGFAALSESGDHRFFGNFTVGAATQFYEFESTEFGFEDFKGDPSVTGSIDLNVGYQYLVTHRASVSLRYRAFILFGDDDFGQDDLTTVHGPEIGVSFRF